MDADRSHEPVSELDVDRELRSLLAADPSPEFVARVRRRVAAEPAPSAWWWSWTFAAAFAGAAAIVIAAIIARPRPIVPAPALAATALPNTSTFPPYVASAFRRTTADTGPAEAGRRVQTPVEAGRRTPFAESDVLLDPRESAALRRVILGVRAGTVDLEPVLRAATVTAMELGPMADIAIPPITIDPLEEGVRP